MPFSLPDLIIESVIRDGLEDLKANPTFLDDIFGQLSDPMASRKYGAAEIQVVKDYLTGASNQEIAIVHSFHLAQAKSPCYSIQLGHTSEDKELARLQDFEADFCEDLTPAELLLLVKESGIVPTSYNPLTGMVRVPDSVDLSTTNQRYIFEDGSAVDHVILSGISNVVGDKFFFVAKQSTVDVINPGLIKSFLTQKALEIRGVTDNVDILIGTHTTEALLTKYLFTLLQFILLSRKPDLINRHFIVSSLSGSDFNRDMKYAGDAVFTRFLTISGKIEHDWRSDQVTLIDNVEITGIPTE